MTQGKRKGRYAGKQPNQAWRASKKSSLVATCRFQSEQQAVLVAFRDYISASSLWLYLLDSLQMRGHP